MNDIALLDGIVIAILSITVCRGLYIGLIREGFSIAALGGAFIAVRYATTPAATWVQEVTNGAIGATAAPLIMGTLIALATIAAVGFVSRGLKLGARAAGLGWADRIGGGVSRCVWCLLSLAQSALRH